MYYFSEVDKKLRYGDNRQIRTGRTHKVKGPITLCNHGLHASKRALDALRYAPGPYLWVVELNGEVIHDKDKSCATERTYIKGFNAESLLREFARKQALINIEKIKPYYTNNDYKIIVKWLKTGNKDMQSAARAASQSAARAAARAARAARAAADAAHAAWSAHAVWYAVDAARTVDAAHAVWYAARTADATHAAWYADRTATHAADAARTAANDMLEKMINERIK